MVDEKPEPGELTERFQAFASGADPAPSRTLPVALILVGVGAVVALGVVVWLLLSV